MKNKWLLGLGAAAAGTAFYVAKMSTEKRAQLKRQLDESVDQVKQTALKYYKYFAEYMDETTTEQTFSEWMKDQVGTVKGKFADQQDNMQAALASLKQSTADLKDRLNQVKEDMQTPAEEEAYQDDIVVDSGIFTEEDEPRVQVFYPHTED
ncbi:hypothetical protein GTO87_02350 [Ligilactobacillus saerimneri]|uniref:YtxH domain-containing protein n=1 Tax=Ligilactobacillus saerimneri TaxID=228229 RepID=A0A7H9EIM5_9LACO|nr:hypothetical protein [Ligilactobacillus saerimneri]QLL77560.1 hypothetical protein GTO87_02350 [Ligilactobacillus saerimneri]